MATAAGTPAVAVSPAALVVVVAARRRPRLHPSRHLWVQ